jgi:amphi-Trp domain-containing protein
VARKIILFKSEERRNLKDVAEFLRLLADKVENGKVILQRDADEVELVLPQMVDFEIQADEKPTKRKTKRSLEIEIEWYVGESGEAVTLG